MDIIPIQSLPVLSSAAPAAARVGLVTTRAIEFNQQQDATYTPSGNEESSRQNREDKALKAAVEPAQGDFGEDSPGENSISLFA